jgi:hypothetical protein
MAYPAAGNVRLLPRVLRGLLERHREDFAQRMEQAQQTLLGGKTATLAYSLSVEEADVQRVGGISTDQLGGSRSPRRATSNQASSPASKTASEQA